MLCPKCFSEVSIVNGAVYCPSCRVYYSSSTEEFLKKYDQEKIKSDFEYFRRTTKTVTTKAQEENYKKTVSKIFLFLGSGVVVFVIFWIILHIGPFGYREKLMTNYGFTTQAKWIMRFTTIMLVEDLKSKDVPANYVHGTNEGKSRAITVDSANDELAIHEVAHFWWSRLRGHEEIRKEFTSDILKLSKLEDVEYSESSSFAKSLVALYCNCPIQDKMDLNNVDDGNYYALMAAFTMGKYKTGDRQLPYFMWKYYDGLFSGKLRVGTCYEADNCQYLKI